MDMKRFIEIMIEMAQDKCICLDTEDINNLKECLEEIK